MLKFKGSLQGIGSLTVTLKVKELANICQPFFVVA
jgi:hypothetical protein